MLNRNQKRVRGVPVDWDEPKLRRTLNLTDIAWNTLQEKADELKISRSEVIERFVRGQISFTG